MLNKRTADAVAPAVFDSLSDRCVQRTVVCDTVVSVLRREVFCSALEQGTMKVVFYFFSFTVYIIAQSRLICNNRAISVCIQFGYQMLTEYVKSVT